MKSWVSTHANLRDPSTGVSGQNWEGEGKQTEAQFLALSHYHMNISICYDETQNLCQDFELPNSPISTLPPMVKLWAGPMPGSGGRRHAGRGPGTLGVPGTSCYRLHGYRCLLRVQPRQRSCENKLLQTKLILIIESYIMQNEGRCPLETSKSEGSK